MAQNYGGMFPLNPEMQLEAQDISRRRALADMLTAGALKPIDPMQNSGKYITPISPVQGLAQLGQALLAAHSNDVVRGEERDLGQRSQQQMINALFGTPTASAPPPSPLIGGDMPQSGGMAAADSPLGTPQLTSGLAQQPVMQRQGGILPPGVDPNAALLAIQLGKGGDVAMKAFEQGLLTEANRTLSQQGVDPRQMGPYVLGKARNDATFTAAPGSVYQRPGEPLAIAPDMKNGLQATPGADGRFSVELMRGYSPANAQVEGDKAAAVKAAEDKFAVPKPYPQPDGTTLYLTDAQARDRANGGAQPPAPQPGQVGKNNPGNLRNPNGVGFQSFETPEAGIAAATKNLMAYGNKGINTIAKVISTWAPPNENDTANYIRFVSSQLGVNPNAPLNMSDPQTLTKLVTAITTMEGGPKGSRGPAQIQAGVQMATGGGFVAGQTTEQKTQEEVDKERRKTSAVAGSKLITDTIAKSFDAAQKAADAIPALHDILSLLDKGVYAAKGPFSGSTVELVAQTLGADPAKVANTADLKSVTIKQLLDMASQLPGTLSDKDMATLKSGQTSPDTMSEQTMRQIVARAEQNLRRVDEQHKRTLARFDKEVFANAFGNSDLTVTFLPPRTPEIAKPVAPVKSPFPAPPQKAVNEFNGWKFEVLPKGR